MKPRNCRACKAAEMVQIESSRAVSAKGVNVTVQGLLSWTCPNCGAEIETPDQIDHNAELIRAAVQTERASAKKNLGLLTGAEIRALRKQWDLTQKQAATIFGGGPVAFAKYEAEEVTQSEAMDKLLRVANALPIAFVWLAKQANDTKAATAAQSRFIARLEEMLDRQRQMHLASIQRIRVPLKMGTSSTLVIGHPSANDQQFKMCAM